MGLGVGSSLSLIERGEEVFYELVQLVVEEEESQLSEVAEEGVKFE